jgi:pyridoxine 5'-phosphate synthase PdxJ
MSSFKIVNAVTLQEQTQNEKKKNNKDNNHKTDADKRNIKKKYRKCVCLEMHLFEECVYICKSARSSE